MMFLQAFLIVSALSWFYWAENYPYITASDFFLSWSAAYVAMLPILIALKLILKKVAPEKAAFLINSLLVLIVSFEHLKIGMEQVAGVRNLRYLYSMGAIVLAWLMLGAVVLLSKFSKWQQVNKGLITLACCLFAFNVLKVAAFNFSVISGADQSLTKVENKQLRQAIENRDPKQRLPNIYYIIADAYTRQDVLEELFDFDNEEFLEFLRRSQFQVASQSYSNYCQTVLSIPSALNFAYLDDLLDYQPAGSEWSEASQTLLKGNALCKVLRALGYKTIYADGSEYAPIRSFGNVADVVLESSRPKTVSMLTILETTAFAPFVDRAMRLLPEEHVSNPHKRHREVVTMSFEKIGAIANEIERPFVLFAHILLPHQPFLFDSTGNEINSDMPYKIWQIYEHSDPRYRDAYIAQLQFTNIKLTQLVDHIRKSEGDDNFFLIIQGDHGSSYQLDTHSIENTNIKERMAILNAVHMPNGKNGAIPNDLTPVNTFRIVLNEILGSDLPLLKNAMYFSTWSDKYGFIDVTEQLSNQSPSVKAND